MRHSLIDHNVELETFRGDEAYVTLSYPRNSELKHIVVELSDVRANDGVRLTFDYDRDGWSIQQASTFEWECDDEVCDPDWQEVFFVEGWAREKKPPPGCEEE